MTITLTREEAQQVLDALWGAVSTCFDQYSHEQVMSNPKHFINQTIETLRSRLSAPEPEQTRSEKMREAGITRRPKGWSKEDEPEPVAWYVRFDSGRTDLLTIPITEARRAMWESAGKRFTVTPLYTAPPQREWQGLTDGEAKKEFEKHNCVISADLAGILSRAIEAKLKEKNA